MPDWLNNDALQTALATAAAALVAAVIGHLVIFRVIARWLLRAHEASVVKAAHRLRWPALLALVLLALHLAGEAAAWPEALRRTAEPFVTVLLVTALAWLALRAVALGRIVLTERMNAAGDSVRARKLVTQLKVLEKIAAVVIVIVAVSLALMSFETIRRIGVSLLASAGLAGLVVGLAAQRTIASVLAGFQIALTQPIRLDDVVVVEGQWGQIEEITLTYVVVKIWDERRLMLPVTHFLEKPFENWTRSESQLLGTVFVYCDYTIPIESVREALIRIIENDPNWDGRLARLQVTNTSEQTVELRGLMSAADSGALWNLRTGVREKLVQHLAAEHREHLPRTRVRLQPDGLETPSAGETDIGA